MTQNAYLHLENDTLRMDVGREKKLQVPLHHLGSVVCLCNIMLSPALMHRCADYGISFVLLNPVAAILHMVAPAPRRGRGLKLLHIPACRIRVRSMPPAFSLREAWQGDVPSCAPRQHQ